MFDQQYPHLASWILSGDGWIELGQDDFSRSQVRILDIGGMIWESDERYATIDTLFQNPAGWRIIAPCPRRS